MRQICLALVLTRKVFFKYFLETLVAVRRGVVNFFSFRQCLAKCFHGKNKSTVKNWLRASGRQQTKATAEERQFFKQNDLPGVRYIISEDDLSAIIEHAKRLKSVKTGSKCKNSVKTKVEFHQNLSDSIDTQPSVFNLLSNSAVVAAAAEQNESTVNINACSEDVLQGSDRKSIKIPQNGPRKCIIENQETITISPTVKRKKKGEHIGRLPQECMDTNLKDAIERLKNFYSATVNPLRKGNKLSESTLNKFLDRVSCFLNFVRVRCPGVPLELSAVNNCECVQAYINYKLEEQNVCVSTAVRENTAIINLAKYVNREEMNPESCEVMVRLSNIHRQLWKEEKAYSLAKKAGLCGEANTDVLYSHILEILRKLREKFDASSGLERSRVLHDFILISLYVTSLCGRAKELRTLKIYDELKAGRQFVFDWKVKCNVLVLSSVDEKFILYENDFKTLSAHGPAKTNLDEPRWLVDYLKLYVNVRIELLTAKPHDFMFFGKKGAPFTPSSLSVYMASIFQRETGVHATTTKLRHALVTHVMSLPESESLRLRESLATLMRHSLKQQQMTYCDISRQEKTLMSRQLLNKSIEQATFGESDLAKCSESVTEPQRFGVGDLCAVLDSISTGEENAKFYLGKIVKFSDDGNEVLLLELRKINDNEPFYKAEVDNSWWEPVGAIVFPLDIVFHSAKSVYELRSSSSDIYHAVLG